MGCLVLVGADIRKEIFGGAGGFWDVGCGEYRRMPREFWHWCRFRKLIPERFGPLR